MANSGQQFVALLGGFMRGMMSADMQRKQKEFEQTRKEKEISPMMQIFLDIAGNVKEPPQNRQQAMEQAMLLQQQEQLAAQPQKPTRQPGVISPGYGWRTPEALGVRKPTQEPETGKKEGIPGMTFVAPEEPETPSAKMTAVVEKGTVPKYQFPTFQEAVAGKKTRYAGEMGGFSKEEKIARIRNIAIDANLSKEEVDQFLKTHGLEEGEEPVEFDRKLNDFLNDLEEPERQRFFAKNPDAENKFYRYKEKEFADKFDPVAIRELSVLNSEIEIMQDQKLQLEFVLSALSDKDPGRAKFMIDIKQIDDKINKMRKPRNMIASTGRRMPESDFQKLFEEEKKIVRTGTEKGTGRKVVQYSDGTYGYAD